MPIEMENQVVARAQAGDARAVNELLERNSRFVFKIVLKYQNLGMAMEDLHQEGLSGMLRALQFYDTGRGARFLTYAVWHIRRAITHALQNKALLIRLPGYFYRAKDNKEKDSDAALRERRDTVRQYLFPVRLDHPFTEDGPSPIDNLCDPEPDALEQLEEGAAGRQVETLLQTLEPRQAHVLRLRFGLNGKPAQTLQEIAADLDISRERARQIEAQALEKLRNKLKMEDILWHLNKKNMKPSKPPSVKLPKNKRQK